ncbi:MAG: hypothetical protein WC827_04700 [Candidatus Paceibacterota bacterium]|jgi:predicted ATP-binding protein involved in virulence
MFPSLEVQAVKLYTKQKELYTKKTEIQKQIDANTFEIVKIENKKFIAKNYKTQAGDTSEKMEKMIGWINSKL